MPLHDTQSLIVILTGASDSLPDPTSNIGPRTHHLINPTGSDITISSVGALPFKNLVGVDVATIQSPARGTVTVSTNGTQWVVRPDLEEWLPVQQSVINLDPTVGQIFRAEIVNDGSPTAGWANRLEIYYSPNPGIRHRTHWNNEYGEGRYTAAKDNTVPFRIYLQESAGPLTHTANAFEITDNPNDRVEIFTVDSDGRASGYTEAYPFSVSGVLTVQAGTHRIYTEGTYVIESIRASVGTAPTGAAILVDVNKNGTTIFTTPANRPTIAIGTNTDTANNPDITTFAANDYLTVDVDQIGSTIAGSDLTVVVRLRKLAPQV